MSISTKEGAALAPLYADGKTREEVSQSRAIPLLPFLFSTPFVCGSDPFCYMLSIGCSKVVRTCARADVKNELDVLLGEGLKPDMVIKVSQLKAYIIAFPLRRVHY